MQRQITRHSPGTGTEDSRQRHASFRIEKVIERCLAEGLVGGEGFAVDASVIKADASRQRRIPGVEAAWDRNASISRPVREYLEALDASEEDRSPPRKVSLTDPASQWTAAPGGPAFYPYSTNYLIDVKAGVIVDVEARTNRVGTHFFFMSTGTEPYSRRSPLPVRQQNCRARNRDAAESASPCRSTCYLDPTEQRRVPVDAHQTSFCRALPSSRILRMARTGVADFSAGAPFR